MTQAQPIGQPSVRMIRPDVQAMHPYVVQDAAGLIKLDAMENPYTLPQPLQQALGERLGAVAVNRYPGQRIEDLKQALRRHARIPAAHGLMLGNGSDELIALLSMACRLPGAVAMAPVPGFVMYAMSAQMHGLQFVGVPLTADFALDETAMLDAVAQSQPALLYLAYPNNPTATLWDAGVIRRLIAAVSQYDGLVVMDEAYQPFSSRSWLSEIEADPQANRQVLLMRTLSKFGLAGVRLGYMSGEQALISQIDKLRPPYNISVLNAECALFALEHADVFEAQAREIRDERDRLQAALARLQGVQVFGSEANMMLMRLQGRGDQAADLVFEGLRTQGVLVKNVSRMHPLLAGCLRLTVGTPPENQRLLDALAFTLQTPTP